MADMLILIALQIKSIQTNLFLPLVASIIPVCYLVRNLNATCQNIVLVCYLGKPHKGQKFKLFNKQKMHVFTAKGVFELFSIFLYIYCDNFLFNTILNTFKNC